MIHEIVFYQCCVVICSVLLGLPGRDERGPMCYHCDHVTNPADCDTVVPCDVNQICGIEQLDWINALHFKMGCTTRTVIKIYSKSKRHFKLSLYI